LIKIAGLGSRKSMFRLFLLKSWSNFLSGLQLAWNNSHCQKTRRRSYPHLHFQNKYEIMALSKKNYLNHINTDEISRPLPLLLPNSQKFPKFCSGSEKKIFYTFFVIDNLSLKIIFIFKYLKKNAMSNCPMFRRTRRLLSKENFKIITWKTYINMISYSLIKN